MSLITVDGTPSDVVVGSTGYNVTINCTWNAGDTVFMFFAGIGTSDAPISVAINTLSWSLVQDSTRNAVLYYDAFTTAVSLYVATPYYSGNNIPILVTFYEYVNTASVQFFALSNVNAGFANAVVGSFTVGPISTSITTTQPNTQILMVQYQFTTYGSAPNAVVPSGFSVLSNVTGLSDYSRAVIALQSAMNTLAGTYSLYGTADPTGYIENDTFFIALQQGTLPPRRRLSDSQII